ncbi:hypothetical protein B0A49_07611 [Cryomyces minteri]|uniref:40S ribosomal protein S21 n=1 Tax=Cryomyces minteri TaxID=331657 RepID=A0A4V5NFJ7_9PEZI|nr:hypothetical protein B0A49_07611 [Cryomyces minteri]
MGSAGWWKSRMTKEKWEETLQNLASVDDGIDQESCALTVLANQDGLIPFTRWITPPNLPKRFTTQMYLYFLPLSSPNSLGPLSGSATEAVIPTPTPDGGIEHTAARFLPPSTWLNMANKGEIILFPPQYFLLHLISPFLSPENLPNVIDHDELQRQRQALMEFVKTSSPPWGEKCISPLAVMKRKGDGRAVLGLDRPGLELENSDRKGDSERVVLVNFNKEGPRNVENERGELVDLYVPRKCSATNRIIKAQDHASVQISVGKVDENGRYTGENQTYALCGFVRAMGESDDSLNRLSQKDGFLKGVWSASR